MRGVAAENSVEVRRNSSIICAAPRGDGWLVSERRVWAGDGVLLGKKSGILSDCPSGLLVSLLLLAVPARTGAPCTV